MNEKLMVVDDSPGMRQIVGTTLRDAGYAVFEAEDGADALRKLEMLPSIDAVLTDINMPQIDGLDLLRSLRASQRFRRTPVLVLTVEPDARKRQDMCAAGCDAWIVKPFAKKNLLETVSRLLGQ